jgi:hypothetical protein
MNRIAIAGAALLAAAGIALAQNEPPAAAPPPPAPLTEAAPPAGGEEAGPHEMRRMDDGQRWRRHHRDRDRDMRRAMRDRPDGAMFHWRDGEGASVVIRCADRDTTQECVDAIMPLLDRLAPGAMPAQ